ncbi:hypothetical protein ACK32A_17040 [Aeromonas enteropelogenes]|uniref:hypothetical protein n=1 Tax=Aeromonas enteropelogenes TaxID=29489 RepID=UPI003988AB6A
MKVYVLVEGVSTEMAVYPVWFDSLIPVKPVFRFIEEFNDFRDSESGIFYVSGQGYPSILNHIENAIENSRAANVDYLIVVVDSDEANPIARENDIRQEINKLEIPDRLQVMIIVQNRCFETYLLANRRCIPRVAQSEELVTYKRYYDVHNNDPELMGNFEPDNTHSQFHFKYAATALRENRIMYSKANPNGVCNTAYLEGILSRTRDTRHLNSFTSLINNVNQIRARLNLNQI